MLQGSGGWDSNSEKWGSSHAWWMAHNRGTAAAVRQWNKVRCTWRTDVGQAASHLALLISAEPPAVFTSGPPHSSVLKPGVNPSSSARLPFIRHDSGFPTPQRHPLSAKPCDRAGRTANHQWGSLGQLFWIRICIIQRQKSYSWTSVMENSGSPEGGWAFTTSSPESRC